MSVLITGAAGFLGRHLVRHLRSTEPDEIVTLDRHIPGDLDAPPDAKVIPGDVLDLPLLVDAIDRCGVEKIVHLAYVLETPEQGVRGQIETNVMGTTNVLEAARLTGISRVVYMSSAYVYPHRRTLVGPAFSEEDPPAPDGVYGTCKVFNEQIAERYAQMYGLEPIGLRFAAVFGPGRADRPHVTADHNVRAEQALRGRSVVMPPAEQLVDWMYVTDAVEVIRLALGARDLAHRVLNVASEHVCAGEITGAIQRLVPDADITVAETPVVTTSLMRTARLRSELSFTPSCGVEEGLGRCLEVFRGARA